MLCLALRLFTFHIRLALAHLLSCVLNKRLSQFASSIFNLLLELIALRIVLGYVFQSPTIHFCALPIQDLVCERVGATNLPCHFHSILEELDFVRLCARSLDELVLVCRPFFLFTFHHQPPLESQFSPWVLHQTQSNYTLASAPNPQWESMCAPLGRVGLPLHATTQSSYPTSSSYSPSIGSHKKSTPLPFTGSHWNPIGSFLSSPTGEK